MHGPPFLYDTPVNYWQELANLLKEKYIQELLLLTKRPVFWAGGFRSALQAQLKPGDEAEGRLNFGPGKAAVWPEDPRSPAGVLLPFSDNLLVAKISFASASFSPLACINFLLRLTGRFLFRRLEWRLARRAPSKFSKCRSPFPLVLWKNGINNAPANCHATLAEPLLS